MNEERKRSHLIGRIIITVILLAVIVVAAFNITKIIFDPYDWVEPSPQYPRWSAVTIEDLVASPEEYLGRGLEIRGHVQIHRADNISRYYSGFFYDNEGNYREWKQFVFEFRHSYYMYGRDLKSRIYTVHYSGTDWTLADSCGNDPITTDTGAVTGCTYIVKGHLIKYGELSEEGTRYYFDVEYIVALSWGFPPELYGEVRTPTNETESSSIQIHIGEDHAGWEISVNTTTIEAEKK